MYSFTGIATKPEQMVRDAMDRAALSQFCATAGHKV
jgi:hypothetical protein